jgi:hypothetical protein
LPNNLENGIARSSITAAGVTGVFVAYAGADQSSSFDGTEGTEVRTRIILLLNLYGNMNATSILKNRAVRHVVWAKRYTYRADAGL